MYDESMTHPMRNELTSIGVKELRSSDDVDELMKEKKGTSLVFVNSVCGCAAGCARPGLGIALKNSSKKPDRITTVFAGVDKEATDRARDYFVGYAPSSPSIGLFRDGNLAHFIERHEIEGVSADQLGELLQSVFNKYCGDVVNEEAEVKSPVSNSEIYVKEVQNLLNNGDDFKLLDCRTPEEREIASIEGSSLITEELADELMTKWDKNTPIVVYCHHGNRSMQAVNALNNNGLKNVKSMAGGIDAWSLEIDPSVPRY